jgi:hypothetical protein
MKREEHEAEGASASPSNPTPAGLSANQQTSIGNASTAGPSNVATSDSVNANCSLSKMAAIVSTLGNSDTVLPLNRTIRSGSSNNKTPTAAPLNQATTVGGVVTSVFSTTSR